MLILDFYRESYHSELENKEKINNRITVPISIVTLLIGSLFFYFDKIDKINSDVSKVFFILFLGMSVIAILFSIFFLFKAYYGYQYDYIPLISEIKNFEDLLYAYHINDGKTEQQAGEFTKRDVELFLAKVYVKSTTNNMIENERKLKYLRHAGWSLSVVLLTAVLAFMPYSLGMKNDDTLEVKITNIKEVKNNYPSNSGEVKQQDKSK